MKLLRMLSFSTGGGIRAVTRRVLAVIGGVALLTGTILSFVPSAASAAPPPIVTSTPVLSVLSATTNGTTLSITFTLSKTESSQQPGKGAYPQNYGLQVDNFKGYSNDFAASTVGGTYSGTLPITGYDPSAGTSITVQAIADDPAAKSTDNSNTVTVVVTSSVPVLPAAAVSSFSHTTSVDKNGNAIYTETFTVTGSGSVELTLASYTCPKGCSSPFTTQVPTQHDTESYAAGSYDRSVTLPCGEYQVDFANGGYVDLPSGAVYGPNLIDTESDTNNAGNCVVTSSSPPPVTTSSAPPVTTSSPVTISSAPPVKTSSSQPPVTTSAPSSTTVPPVASVSYPGAAHTDIGTLTSTTTHPYVEIGILLMVAGGLIFVGIGATRSRYAGRHKV